MKYLALFGSRGGIWGLGGFWLGTTFHFIFFEILL